MQRQRLASYEIDTIKAIAKRAVALMYSIDDRVEIDERDIVLDLTAAYAGGCKLRLTDLLTADDRDFAHDVFGINKYLDRATYELKDCFRPRYAA